jgi:hypothetical protein
MTSYLCSVSPAVVFWLGAVAGGTVMAITIMGWLAVSERITSRKMLRKAENGGVDIVLPTGRQGRLLLAPEAAAQ